MIEDVRGRASSVSMLIDQGQLTLSQHRSPPGPFKPLNRMLRTRLLSKGSIGRKAHQSFIFISSSSFFTLLPPMMQWEEGAAGVGVREYAFLHNWFVHWLLCYLQYGAQGIIFSSSSFPTPITWMMPLGSLRRQNELLHARHDLLGQWSQIHE